MPALHELVSAVRADTKLNLGCGDDIRDGWVNADIAELPGVDVVVDISEVPLPFDDDQFGLILCKDVLEHVESVPATMAELYRILSPGGTLVFECPHFSSRNVHLDPTHRRGFSIDTAAIFVRGARRSYYFDFGFTALDGATILFYRRPWLPWNYIAEWVFNLHPFVQRVYEHTFLARLFPALNVVGALVK